MEFTASNRTVYEVGSYFLSPSHNLFQIISDSDKGLAILDVQKGRIESEFQDSIEDLLKYTYLKKMKSLKQVEKACFEII